MCSSSSILGVKPATSCLDGKKIKLTKDGHVVVDKFMQTSQKDVYAIGDCVEFPLWKNNSGNKPGGERRVTLPYWYLAQVQGKTIKSVFHQKIFSRSYSSSCYTRQERE